MNTKQLLSMIFILGMAFFLLSTSTLLFSQDKPMNHTGKPVPPTSNTEKTADSPSTFGPDILKVLLGIILGGGFLKYIQYLRRNKDARQKKQAVMDAEKKFKENEVTTAAKTAEEIYCAALKEELGFINMLGSPQLESKAVKLEEAFVSLRISQYWRSENRFEPCQDPGIEMPGTGCYFSPEEAMKRAFKQYRLLLIIGDPGSGKTTLLKYYAVTCLDKYTGKYRQLGFTREILPIYFPLRELEFDKNNEPGSLPENLAKWAEKHLLNIPAQQFHTWLQDHDTLVLLDGLDEIGKKEQRKKVCLWIKRMFPGLPKARFVVTSRATGYRKLDGIELVLPHIRADIIDFTPAQQEEFLKKWFRAVYLAGLPPENLPEPDWRKRQIKQADQRSKTIIDFLKKEENQALQELASVPMLLQIMAIIWKDRKHLPKSRPALFDAALNYLLAYRDEEKEIEPLLPAEESRRVLAPTALWMQEKLQKDEAPKETMHQVMQPILDTLEGQPGASVFCNYLRDRAGLIADYDRDHYIFRHKSFREFLSGIQSIKTSGQPDRLKLLVEHFNRDWWEETLRFFMSLSDDEIFDEFMRLFFQSSVSKQLDAHRQTLLQHLVRESPQKKIDALKEHLNSDSLNSHQRRYVMECLKTIGTNDAIKTIENLNKSKLDESNLSYAQDIVAEASAKPGPVIPRIGEKEPLLQDTFRNPFEYNVEYIKIPGGTYRYSVSKQKVTVPDLYFCKYPVTYKRYRRFISFLAGKEKELEKELSVDLYAEHLLKFAATIKGYLEYMGKDPGEWKNKFRSESDDDKKFNGDDQPVVAVSWYDARAYCFWLSCLDAAVRKEKQLLTGDSSGLTSIYRLPAEEEWEWAAGGETDGSIRKYPWLKDKGEPGENLANYGEHVGATTPVDRYPGGATPLGLMDMAGNVWEWMENYYDKNEAWKARRGGSWYDEKMSLVCSARVDYNPGNVWLRSNGFRVLRALPPVI
jgi:formylglycine-generating enzyme required for sulfatase activity/energy-coupling factor transporter ATP-binding protein EcfA2